MQARRTFLYYKKLYIEFSPVDIRVYMQKPYDHWIISGISAKAAVDNKIVTNLNRGGTVLAFKDVFQSASYSNEAINKLTKSHG